MARYVVLLKGINLGRANRIAMSELRDMVRDLGYQEARTHLQSGNLLLTAPNSGPDDVAQAIEAGIAQRWARSVSCLTRTRDDLLDVIANNPLCTEEIDGSKMVALFLSDTPRADLLAANDPTGLDPEHVRMGDDVVYQWCPDGILAAPNVAAFVEKYLKVTVTGRNWNTVLKLADLLAA